MKIVLASTSPRRKELLGKIVKLFDIVPPQVNEITDVTLPPEEIVMQNSLLKARDVARNEDDSIIIGADNVVFLEGKILGKPKSINDARKMLQFLSGKIHLVYSGVTVINTSTGEEVTDYNFAEVKFKELEDEEIEWYLSTGEPMDKAGAYAIQGYGGLFIEWINGDYYSIVGFPLHKLYLILKRMEVI